MIKKICILSVLILAACSHTPPQKVAEVVKPTIVLIHGYHSDGAIWSAVKEKLGDTYAVLTPDLPGRKDSENPTLLQMAQSVCEVIPTKSVVVGHSFGGAVMNQMVGVCPEKIMRLIYLTALVPLNGETAIQAMSADDEKGYTKAVKVEKRLIPRSAKTYFEMMDSQLDKKNLPKNRLYSESFTPGKGVVTYDEAVFAKIPKFYIMATLDKVITLPTQRKYIERTDMAQTGEIAAGHLPQLSKPNEVAQAILQSFR